MAGAGGANMDKFEEYFQRADVDRDGRISGNEAVSFLQGSNLPRQVLGNIWTHVDQTRTGFLSRPEFYNALKLVTVAQSKRELTPDIVKAALYGPASAKIPAPQINVASASGPPPVAASPSSQMGATHQQSPQSFGFRGPAPSSPIVNQQPGTAVPIAGMNQQLRPMPSPTGLNQQFGMTPPRSGVNQQLLQAQPATSMNQQFGQVQPPNTSVNRQFGQLQPPSAGMNQQFRSAPPSANMNQQFHSSQGNQMRPPLSMPTGPTSRPPQVASSVNVSEASTDVGFQNTNNAWHVGKSVSASSGPATQVLDRTVSPSISPVAPKPQDPLATFSIAAAKDPKGSFSSGNGSNADPMFAGDVFANQFSSQKVSSVPQPPASSLPTSSAIVPVTADSQSLSKPDPFEALQSSLVKPSIGVQAVKTPSIPRSNLQAPTQVTSPVLSSGVQAGIGNSTSESSQISWPKMTRADVQKYANVFREVDNDRDGKITGDQARNLFLSWKIPREVLKQVWDLSDQDSDSMLSLREFCIALYFMERFKEGRPPPPVLPNSVMLDESLLSMAGPPTAYMGWGPATGIRPPHGLSGSQHIRPGLRPPMQPVVSQADGSMQFNQKSARGDTVDNAHANQLSNGQVNFVDSESQEAAETTEKVDNEQVFMDSREKLEFYRTKMQDLVLYKSRCDNRLNEITERARADKSEAELLEKKYQEKYKQVSDIHSKLTMEEASFREIQARKMELQQAIIKMEQGGSADGILQVRADRIQSDLEELLKALTDRCKKHNMDIKSSALIELPPGWQPGIPEFAAIWDEEWDKFEDEGFSFDVALPENAKSSSIQRENSSPTHSFSPDSQSNAANSEKPFDSGVSAFDAESVFSADESKSPRESPRRQTMYESPSKEYADDHFRKSFDGDAETHRSFDESTWGDFDNNDDVDSVWGFNAKDSDHVKPEDKYFFGSNDFGASSDKSVSPQTDGAFQKNNMFAFEDSAPGSPLSKAGNSPRYSVGSRDPFFDSFSRYDSFSTHDHGSSPHRENPTGFDSINSTRGFDHSSNYSFDDSDPFGSSGPFKVSSETSKDNY